MCDRACESTVSLTLDEYESVRRDSRHFAVVPGHVFPEAERVVARGDDFEVVEKLGDAVEVVDAADHRERGTSGRRRGNGT